MKTFKTWMPNSVVCSQKAQQANDGLKSFYKLGIEAKRPPVQTPTTHVAIILTFFLPAGTRKINRRLLEPFKGQSYEALSTCRGIQKLVNTVTRMESHLLNVDLLIRMIALLITANKMGN